MRILAPVLVLAAVTLGGGTLMYALGGGRWSFADAVYMAVNAVSTAGFREIDGMDRVHFSRVGWRRRS